LTRRRIFLAVAVLVLTCAGGAAAAWWWNDRETRDVRGSSTREFVTTEQTSTREREEVETEPWPFYGFTADRARNAVDFDHRPPYRRVWGLDGGRLIEFPPVIAYGRLYFATISGIFRAVDARRGKVVWRRDLGYTSAASPAVGDGVVYQPLMNRKGAQRGPSSGLVLAMDAETGEDVWRFRTGAVESSPVLVDGTLYFGTFDDRLYALDARTGKVRWFFETGDDVKGGPAYRDGVVYTGSYDGKVYAVDARTGKLRWSSESQGGLLGAGNFYAGPAIGYGRVFIGNTDGKVYAFGAKSGDLLWSKTTGDYVYSSAALGDRIVYVGSYDGRLYALDAATGDVRWSFDAEGSISGSPTIMAGLVYFSTFAGKTYVVDAAKGKAVLTLPDGRYTPLAADEQRVYIVGRTTIHAFKSRRR
jgi:outer membrane protein assembly factor BamB